MLAFAAICALYVIALGKLTGILVVVAMIFHELGHLYVFRCAGIKATIMILFPLGAVALPINDDENKKSDTLPYRTLGWLMLAGLIVNSLLAITGIVMMTRSGNIREVGQALLYVNIVLMGLNLPPISNLDGGIFFRIISSSMTRRNANILAAAITTTVLASLLGIMINFDLEWKELLIALVRNYGASSLVLISIITLWSSVNHKDKLMPIVPESMGALETTVPLLAYLVLFALVISTLLIGIV